MERAWAERALHLEGAVAAVESEIQRLRDLDRRDGLTGVANRATFLEAFQVEWRRNRREATPLATVFFAVDGFKTIDRSQGSDAGDVSNVTLSAGLAATVPGKEDPGLLLAEAEAALAAALSRGLSVRKDGSSWTSTDSR